MSTRIIPISLGFVYIYLVVGDTGRTILVDSGVPGQGQKILKEMASQGISPTSLSLIHITHAHQDHYGSAKELSEVTGAPISIQQNDVPGLEGGYGMPVVPTNLLGRLMSFVAKRSCINVPVKPDVVFASDLKLDAFGVAGKVIHTPGHTPGSSSVVIGSEVIIGDLIDGGLFLKGNARMPMIAYNEPELRRSIESIKLMKPTFIHCGHGGSLTLDRLSGL